MKNDEPLWRVVGTLVFTATLMAAAVLAAIAIALASGAIE